MEQNEDCNMEQNVEINLNEFNYDFRKEFIKFLIELGFSITYKKEIIVGNRIIPISENQK